ncbi:putative transmembrane protein [Toxoplasma gondii TgCatPRC2]|uniref:Transmembrane protein n=14 Tax=Toxoplasma gondii TaxID=5811 RepID=A0A125YZG3_TOXGV|nr:hypothetical protein TGME49_306680 [Toxoplasma gondii ME49]EPR57523.1 hypothetical protein TGGT1_306680 [Toxoplasma gondii GT1]ESS28962.1 putative transmembrane protein [Toxoplasma gondii VEG]KAF4644819.1 hypothetical protein TGRH88_018130 [Toxoplasma gondii]KFG30154.1 putative transmembrane protein [Toxoplasma gondii p89]KFG33638.1 putative transmembrane protein [Toxoplasma gondii GAB2-2007-GAL-DOM2]KFG44780.1 putative transmembrane protein [Toxoplasma gondii FOU]KFH02795.1 putative tran|eukprot:XP_018636186.1 hypothetical protein TGME49_306680 [Toxoplasma gondii ME49]
MASVDSPSILPGRLTGTGTDKIAVVPRKSVKRLFVQAKLKLHHNGARLLPLCAFVTMMAISFLLFDIFSANPTSVAVADAYPWFDDMDDVGDERYYSHFLSEMDDDSVESRYPPASGDSSDNSPFGHFRIDFRAGTGKVSGRRRGRRRVPPAVHRRAAMRRRMRIDLLALAALITACSAAFLWTRKLQLKLQEEEAAVEALQKDKHSCWSGDHYRRWNSRKFTCWQPGSVGICG